MSLRDRLAAELVGRRRVVLLVLVLTVVAVGAGAAQLEEESGLPEFSVGTEEEAALSEIRATFGTARENATVARIVVEDENVLKKSTLVETLELQARLRANGTVGPTLTEEEPTVGIANLIARAAMGPEAGDSQPPIEEQIERLESMDQRRIDLFVEVLLSEDGGAASDALAFLPAEYEPGSTEASSTMIVVFQSAPQQPAGQATDEVVAAQLSMQESTGELSDVDDAFVVGNGVISDEMERSQEDSLSILGPLALLFVLVVLGLTYRDVVDVALSVVGIVLVQVWTFGTLGWLGISFNPILVAIPILLVGLSIDYGIHVFMRYREARTDGSPPSGAMTLSLSGVGPALVWVTATTVVGFLSNLATPLGPIRDLGVMSAVGIVGALVVFGGLIPLLKVELDGFRERFGFDRTRRPIGAAGGGLGRILSVGSRAARRAPVVVLVLALVATLATTAAATQVSTEFEPEDNIADEAPDWTDHLPESMEPGEYSAKANVERANDRFLRHGSRVEFLLDGDPTAPDTLERVAAAKDRAAEQPVVVALANGGPGGTGPLSVVDRATARNPAFAERVAAHDTTGDGIPDTDLETLYDDLYDVAPEEAGRVLERTGGEYETLRLAVAVDPTAQGTDVVEQAQAVADELAGEDGVVTVTGDPVVHQQMQDELLGTLLTSLVVTVLVVLAILAVVYRVVHGSATLGLVTLVPILLVVSWIVGTMSVLGYPLSVLTVIVASLTVGIGIDYSIHVGERFRQELDRARSIDGAISTTIRGTGSALLGSATTTAAGFGVLGFALVPTLQQFGTITALMIVYAFLASVLVLPSALVLWARHLGPGEVDVGATATGSTLPETSGGD